MEISTIICVVISLMVGYFLCRIKDYHKQVPCDLNAELPIVCGRREDGTVSTQHLVQWLEDRIDKTGYWQNTWYPPKNRSYIKQVLLPGPDDRAWLNYFVIMLTELGMDLVIVKRDPKGKTTISGDEYHCHVKLTEKIF